MDEHKAAEGATIAVERLLTEIATAERDGTIASPVATRLQQLLKDLDNYLPFLEPLLKKALPPKSRLPRSRATQPLRRSLDEVNGPRMLAPTVRPAPLALSDAEKQILRLLQQRKEWMKLAAIVKHVQVPVEEATGAVVHLRRLNLVSAGAALDGGVIYRAKDNSR